MPNADSLATVGAALPANGADTVFVIHLVPTVPVGTQSAALPRRVVVTPRDMGNDVG